MAEILVTRIAIVYEDIDKEFELSAPSQLVKILFEGTPSERVFHKVHLKMSFSCIFSEG